MGKGTIISHLGSGRYSVQINFHGRARVEAKIDALNEQISDLQDQIDGMEDGQEKDILILKKKALEKYVIWYGNQMPDDESVTAWCADLTEDLSGVVGTIEIPGERQRVLIRPGYNNRASYSQSRDGQIQPVIASSPSAVFLNLAVFPGWQKWKPTYRKGIISEINYSTNKCSVCIDGEFSSQLSLNINQGEDWSDCDAAIHQGYSQFCSDNPSHPICTNTTIGNPLYVTSSMYNQLSSINEQVNSEHEYQTDKSGYGIGDYWNIMGAGEKGDCEDFTLTKIDALINAGWSPSNLQIALCYTETGSYHAVLLIRTQNKGNLILDNRHDQVMNQSSLPYSWDRVQRAGSDWGLYTGKIEDVPIEYMTCNAAAFVDGDYVVVEFESQDWDDPKVIGFLTDPDSCDMFIYCVLGRDSGAGELNQQYNILTDSWAEKAAPNFPYNTYDWRQFVAVRYAGYGWIFGGWSPEMHDPYTWEWHTLKEVRAYSPQSDSWLYGYPNFSGNARAYVGGFAMGSKAYCVAGSEYPSGYLPFTADQNYDDIDEFNFLTYTWSVKNAYSEKLFDAEGFTDANGEGRILGGNRAEALEMPDPTGQHKKYNQAGDSWTIQGAFEGGRFHHAVFECNGYGFISGGLMRYPKFENDANATWSGNIIKVTKNCQKYDHVSGIWITQTQQPTYEINHYGVKNGMNNRGWKTEPGTIGVYTFLYNYNPSTYVWAATSGVPLYWGDDGGAFGL